jgi:hemoglobin/transferrin/lactoferrin receptor protein
LVNYIDLTGHLWATVAHSIMYNNTGFHAPQFGKGYQNELDEGYVHSLKSDLNNIKMGADINNSATFYTNGLSCVFEDINPRRSPYQDDLDDNRVERNAVCHEYSLTNSLEYKLNKSSKDMPNPSVCQITGLLQCLI